MCYWSIANINKEKKYILSKIVTIPLKTTFKKKIVEYIWSLSLYVYYYYYYYDMYIIFVDLIRLLYLIRKSITFILYITKQ